MVYIRKFSQKICILGKDKREGVFWGKKPILVLEEVIEYSKA